MRRGRRHHSYETATDRSLGCVRRRVAVWLGVLLVFFNVLSGAAVSARADETQPWAAALSADRIVVCTAAGMVVMDHDGNVVDHPGDTAQAPCAFCFPLAHGGVDVPVTVEIAVTLGRSALSPYLPARQDGFRAVWRGAAAPPRAPPLS